MSNNDGFGAFVRSLLPALLLVAISGAAACSSDTGDDDAAGGSGGTASGGTTSGGSSGTSGSASSLADRCDTLCTNLTIARCSDFDAASCHKGCPVIDRLAGKNICKAEYEADIGCGLALSRADVCRYELNDATALCVSETNASSACYKSYCASNSSPDCPH